MTTEWKVIKEYPQYEISKDGEVRKTDTKKILKQRISTRGDLVVRIGRNDTLVSRLLGLTFIPNPYNYNLVFHKDKNKLNNSLDNLVWKTDKNRYEIKDNYVIGYDINDNKFYIDLDDYERVSAYQWHKDDTEYFISSKTKKHNAIRLHNFIMNEKYIDHINRDKSDNRKNNLRVASISENNRNRSKGKNNSSGFIGISKGKYSKKWGESWRVSIVVNKKRISLGTYHNLEEALKVRLKAEKKYFGDFAPQKHLFKKYNI